MTYSWIFKFTLLSKIPLLFSFKYDLYVKCSQYVILNVNLIFQTMGGDFSSKGQQDCAKGIYCLAGTY